MIVVEGPDGAGKTTLIERLAAELGLPVHERAVADRTGPDGRDLWAWTCRDVMSWDTQPLSVYDRHPLVSEYVYGPICRGKLPPGFTNPSSRAMLERFRRRALLVFCSPGYDVVRDNVNGEVEQMGGVADNIESIYWSYRAIRANWSGWAVDYDYLSPDLKGSYASVLRAARLHMTTWKATP